MKYPENEQKEWFVEVVTRDGFEGLDCFNSKHRSFALRGSYRKVLCMPGDFEFEVIVNIVTTINISTFIVIILVSVICDLLQIKKYTDPNEPLVKTDWDKMLEADENLRMLEEKKIQVRSNR